MWHRNSSNFLFFRLFFDPTFFLARASHTCRSSLTSCVSSFVCTAAVLAHEPTAAPNALMVVMLYARFPALNYSIPCTGFFVSLSLALDVDIDTAGIRRSLKASGRRQKQRT